MTIYLYIEGRFQPPVRRWLLTLAATRALIQGDKGRHTAHSTHTGTAHSSQESPDATSTTVHSTHTSTVATRSNRTRFCASIKIARAVRRGVRAARHL